MYSGAVVAQLKKESPEESEMTDSSRKPIKLYDKDVAKTFISGPVPVKQERASDVTEETGNKGNISHDKEEQLDDDIDEEQNIIVFSPRFLEDDPLGSSTINDDPTDVPLETVPSWGLHDKTAGSAGGVTQVKEEWIDDIVMAQNEMSDLCTVEDLSADCFAVKEEPAASVTVNPPRSPIQAAGRSAKVIEVKEEWLEDVTVEESETSGITTEAPSGNSLVSNEKLSSQGATQFGELPPLEEEFGFEIKAQLGTNMKKPSEVDEEAGSETTGRSSVAFDLLEKNRKVDLKFVYSSNMCKYRSESKINVDVHGRLHNVCKGEKTYVCELCNYRCNDAEKLKNHKRTHSGEKPFVCEACNYRCKRPSDWMNHMRIHSEEKTFLCEVCNYICRRAGHLTDHRRTHSGEKPFVCEVCNYSCSRAGDLKKHMIIHSGAKPFVCEICSHRCRRASDLKNHMIIHSGSKPFVCEVCNYSSSRASDLKKHKRTHSGEEPFVGEVCNYRRSKAGYLKKHMRVHSGVKPYA